MSAFRTPSDTGNSERRLRRSGRIQSKARTIRSASGRRNSLSARYPVNGAWPAEMRIDMLAGYLDFRSVRELALAISRGEAPSPTSYRGAGRSREAVWAKVIVDDHVAPGRTFSQNLTKANLVALV
jgi:hypothetical protein